MGNVVIDNKHTCCRAHYTPDFEIGGTVSILKCKIKSNARVQGPTSTSYSFVYSYDEIPIHKGTLHLCNRTISFDPDGSARFNDHNLFSLYHPRKLKYQFMIFWHSGDHTFKKESVQMHLTDVDDFIHHPHLPYIVTVKFSQFRFSNLLEIMCHSDNGILTARTEDRIKCMKAVIPVHTNTDYDNWYPSRTGALIYVKHKKVYNSNDRRQYKSFINHVFIYRQAPSILK